MMNLAEEPILIEQARHDPEAFAVLYQHHLRPVYNYLFRRVGSVQEAEDLTAQVFTEALEGLLNGRFHGGSFAAWLFTIARRRAADYYRQHNPSALAELGDPMSADSEPLASIEERDTRERLERLLAELDDEKQELLRLRFSAGLSFAEIAQIKRSTEAAIKMAFYRLLDWLRTNWEVKNG